MVLLDFMIRLPLFLIRDSAVQYFKFVASNPITIKTKVRAAVPSLDQALPDIPYCCSVLQHHSPCSHALVEPCWH